MNRTLEKLHLRCVGRSGPFLGSAHLWAPGGHGGLSSAPHLRMRLLGPRGGVCLLSLKVHSSLLSHFFELTVLTHVWWLKLTPSRNEAGSLNFQPASTIVIPGASSHSVRSGFVSGLAPGLLPLTALSLLRHVLVLQSRGSDAPEFCVVPCHVSRECGLPGLYRHCSAIGK